jgi:cell division protein FtsX
MNMNQRTRRKRLRRRGMMTLEVVMTIGVMVPIAGALYFLGIKMCAAAYEAISALVSWPFL